VLCKPKGCAAKEISAKDVPFEVGKFKFKYLTDLFEKNRKKYNGAYRENLKKIKLS